jgi:uncharacterized protein YbjQ (UPF0145 family)
MDWFFKEIEKFNAELAKAPDWLLDIFGGSTIVDAIVNNSLQFFIFTILGWLIATFLERKHISYLAKKEQQLVEIKLNNVKKIVNDYQGDSAFLMGSVVMAHDYFRGFFIVLRKIIGGNISAYERITQRGRREAIIRLKENALNQGFNKVINVRFDSTKVGNHITAIEIIAYGTGIKVTEG